MNQAPTATSDRDSSPFHPGERLLQTQAGVREEAEKRGRRMLSADINAQQAQFFQQLPFVIAGHTDGDGQPWASLLTGSPGFITVDTSRGQAVLRPTANPNGVAAAAGSTMGLLGIELATRRRNRMNGAVMDDDDQGWHIRIEQAYGNCPKYINEREWPQALFAGAYRCSESLGLAAPARDLVSVADTFFIATSSGNKGADPATSRSAWGADVSHRGGAAGFLRARGDHLVFDDYPGNNMFNTLGNLNHYPRCGLLALDFASGDMVQLAASAEIVFAGEDRSVELHVHTTRYWHRLDTGIPGGP